MNQKNDNLNIFVYDKDLIEKYNKIDGNSHEFNLKVLSIVCNHIYEHEQKMENQINRKQDLQENMKKWREKWALKEKEQRRKNYKLRTIQKQDEIKNTRKKVKIIGVSMLFFSTGVLFQYFK